MVTILILVLMTLYTNLIHLIYIQEDGTGSISMLIIIDYRNLYIKGMAIWTYILLLVGKRIWLFCMRVLMGHYRLLVRRLRVRLRKLMLVRVKYILCNLGRYVNDIFWWGRILWIWRCRVWGIRCFRVIIGMIRNVHRKLSR